MYKRQPIKPLVPHYENGVVVVRISASTPTTARQKAMDWARNLAKKYSQNHIWW